MFLIAHVNNEYFSISLADNYRRMRSFILNWYPKTFTDQGRKMTHNIPILIEYPYARFSRPRK